MVQDLIEPVTPEQVTAILDPAHLFAGCLDGFCDVAGNGLFVALVHLLLEQAPVEFGLVFLRPALDSFPGRSQPTRPVEIPPAETLPLYVAVVTAARGLNVRRNPNTDNTPLRSLRMGERVDVYGVENGWAWIKPDRAEWVYAYYLKRI